MPREFDTDMGGSRRQFPSTHWSVLLEFKDPDHPKYQATLSEFIQRYWKPVYHQIRASGNMSVEDAKDHTQQFFAMLMSRRDLQRLCPDRGSLRGFLKAALRNHLASAGRKRMAREPKDGARLFRFDEAEREWASAAREPDAFDAEWARGVLTAALEKLKEAYDGQGKSVHYEILKAYCIEPLDVKTEDPSYEDLAERFGLTRAQVRNHLFAARRRMREILRETISEYVGPGESVDDELNFLLSL